MRIINVDTITQNIKDMCIKANHFLAEDMDQGDEACVGYRTVSSWTPDFRSAAG